MWSPKLKWNRKYATEITADDDGEHESIAGWVHEKRDLGGVFFLIVRDLGGFAQALHKGEVEKELFERVKRVPRESVVAIEGKVKSEKKEEQNVREKNGKKSMLARLLFE